MKYDDHNCEVSQRKSVQVPICPLCNQAVSCQRNQQPDEVVSAHIDRDCKSDPALNRRRIYTNRCSLKTCKQKEAVPLSCEKCLKTFCFKHRFPDDHNCKGFEDSGRQITRAGAAALDRIRPQATNISLTSSSSSSSSSTRPTASAASAMSSDDDLAMAIRLSLHEGTQEDEDYLLAKALQESEQEAARKNQAKSSSSVINNQDSNSSSSNKHEKSCCIQ